MSGEPEAHSWTPNLQETPSESSETESSEATDPEDDDECWESGTMNDVSLLCTVCRNVQHRIV